MSGKPWKLVHFRRLIPDAPHYVHAEFDVELNSGAAFRNVRLVRQGKHFQPSRIEADPQLTVKIIDRAIAELEK